jgi:hypothetical protein
VSETKAQSEYVAFLIAMILIVAVLVPLFLILSNYSVPEVKPVNYQTIAKEQIIGGSVLVFFNSTPSKPFLYVAHGNQNFVLQAVYYTKGGIWYNITNHVKAVTTVNGAPQTYPLPVPLIYNFILPSYVWNYTLLLQIEAYNVTVFASVYPNETAFA